ncbi:malate dehydrogenase [Haladaptatus sp. CMAA 1911]|uniref:malate dehydrogenase n=1 Tax=unclassified Haladaptatus TaxID=2622732 RepID=UPI003753EF48
MEVAVIGGAGTIGATTAYTLTLLAPDADVTLVDVQDDAAEGHAIDIRTSLGHGSHPAGARGPTGSGTVTAAAPGSEAVADADCVVVAASIPRPDDSAKRGGRLSFLERNGELVDDIASWMGSVEPRPVVTVTNPLDPINHRMWRALGWDRRYCIGYALSETARLADQVARHADVRPSDVTCYTMGQHGEHLVPLFSRTTVEDEPITLSPDERERISEAVKDVPYDIMALRGSEETSRWVTARGVASLVASVLDGGPDEPVCCSVPLDGEYGYRDLSLSVPVRLSEDGVEEIIEWELSQAERTALDEAAEAVGELCQ